jgi:hypothetical protein
MQKIYTVRKRTGFLNVTAGITTSYPWAVRAQSNNIINFNKQIK